MLLRSIFLFALVAGGSVQAVVLNEDGIVCPIVGNLALVFMQGKDLHPSLKTGDPSTGEVRDLSGPEIKYNPQLDSDPAFVEVVARSSTHGKHPARGLSSALYARYLGESEIGFYGLEASSKADADWWETTTRAIWAKNAGLGRARVHRAGLIVLVVWNDGTSEDIWEAVNGVVVQRMKPLTESDRSP